MAHQPIEELLPKSGYSIYKLVRMASQRAKELADGKRRMVNVSSEEKTTTVAMEEIRNGLIVLKDVADQFAPPSQATKKKKSGDQDLQPEMSAS